jgi:hypothetical protein
MSVRLASSSSVDVRCHRTIRRDHSRVCRVLRSDSTPGPVRNAAAASSCGPCCRPADVATPGCRNPAKAPERRCRSRGQEVLVPGDRQKKKGDITHYRSADTRVAPKYWTLTKLKRVLD